MPADPQHTPSDEAVEDVENASRTGFVVEASAAASHPDPDDLTPEQRRHLGLGQTEQTEQSEDTTP